MAVLWHKLTGPMAPQFWGMVITCFVLPVPILAFKRSRTPAGVMIASLSILVGMWLERYTIVVGTMLNPRLTFNHGSYTPSWVEISIMVGAFAYFAFLFIVFSRLFPIVSIWEIKEGYRLEGGSKEIAPLTASGTEA